MQVIKVENLSNQYAIGSKTLVGRSVSVGYLEPYIFELPVNGTISLSTAARAQNELWLLTQAGEVALKHRMRYFLVGSTVSIFYGQKVTREEGAGFRQAIFHGRPPFTSISASVSSGPGRTTPCAAEIAASSTLVSAAAWVAIGAMSSLSSCTATGAIDSANVATG